MSHLSVAPPAQGDWYDLTEITADVLARLRLSEGDVDASRIEALVPVAAMHINDELDRVNELTPEGTIDTEDVDQDEDITELNPNNVTPTILEALKRLTIELYRRGKVGRDGNVPVEFGPAIEVVQGDLSPHKSRWGLA